MLFFFFKQKTAYEMRISDWSSDVCSSDLLAAHGHAFGIADAAQRRSRKNAGADGADNAADTVHAEDIGRVVIAELVLHDRHEEVAEARGDRTENDRADRTDRAGSRRHRDQAGDDTRCGTEHGGL